MIIVAASPAASLAQSASSAKREYRGPATPLQNAGALATADKKSQNVVKGYSTSSTVTVIW